MDDKKKIDLIKKRNLELSKQLEELKLVIKNKPENDNSEYAVSLIEELEGIRAEWLTSLNSLKKKDEECTSLINEMFEIRNIMYSMGFKIPWYKKLLMRFKK